MSIDTKKSAGWISTADFFNSQRGILALVLIDIYDSEIIQRYGATTFRTQLNK